jgi:cytochrome c-type biogenesis protein
MITDIFIISAFIAGFITFLAPCTLPLVPSYLGFISGVDFGELKDLKKAREIKKKIFFNGLFFIVGFSLIFVLFGSLVGFLGQTLIFYKSILTRIGGFFVILFGLFMLNILKLPILQKERKIKLPKFLKIGKLSTSFLIGMAFGLGWTPCVGPVLGSILLLASTSASVLQGAFLLLVFSFGLSVPFLLIALIFSKATEYISKISKYLKIISVIGGIFLIFLGILLITNNFSFLLESELFKIINYDKLLDLL